MQHKIRVVIGYLRFFKRPLTPMWAAKCMITKLSSERFSQPSQFSFRLMDLPCRNPSVGSLKHVSFGVCICSCQMCSMAFISHLLQPLKTVLLLQCRQDYAC
ncbi:hypothetical protein NP493_205g02003 [Ridgeia piscesae]|uniref:Uncharacterized protein n=1 Tax=Ridgeia piscesae TaxID=27915 RepID=A0AAD9UEH0_RIDPI|nr:hypothetical protein NP493_205g02003 [Ridgeia piscesae]